MPRKIEGIELNIPDGEINLSYYDESAVRRDRLVAAAAELESSLTDDQRADLKTAGELYRRAGSTLRERAGRLIEDAYTPIYVRPTDDEPARTNVRPAESRPERGSDDVRFTGVITNIDVSRGEDDRVRASLTISQDPINEDGGSGIRVSHDVVTSARMATMIERNPRDFVPNTPVIVVGYRRTRKSSPQSPEGGEYILATRIKRRKVDKRPA